MHTIPLLLILFAAAFPIALAVSWTFGYCHLVLKSTREAVTEAIERGQEEAGQRREAELRALEEARLPVRTTTF
jgi:hypothetical protein